jgi:hypothetical protein
MDVQVTNPAALDELREALVRFRSELLVAIAETDAELKRLRSHLEHERIPALRGSLPMMREELVRTKSALARKQMNADALRIHVSVVDEKLAIDRANVRLRHQEALVQRTGAWTRRLEREHSLLKGSIAPLSTLVDRDLPDAISRLRAMALAIESYLSIRSHASLEEQLLIREKVESVLRQGFVLAEGTPTSAADSEVDGDGREKRA